VKRLHDIGSRITRRSVGSAPAELKEYPDWIRLGAGRRLRYRFCMSETEDRILQALLELERAVASMPTANPKPNLLPLFSRLDELTRQLPREADPTLLHYLHKKSYEKARLFLQGREAENARGNCHGHV
jgi:hypothetical protein